MERIEEEEKIMDIEPSPQIPKVQFTQGQQGISVNPFHRKKKILKRPFSN